MPKLDFVSHIVLVASCQLQNMPNARVAIFRCFANPRQTARGMVFPSDDADSDDVADEVNADGAGETEDERWLMDGV